jgi:hypothetical protein
MRDRLRHHLKTLAELSDYQTFGVCSPTVQGGFTALKSYVNALCYEARFEIPIAPEPVYIKFHSLSKSWYLESYPGAGRGVLITFHSNINDDLNGTYGYFPLNLYEVDVQER